MGNTMGLLLQAVSSIIHVFARSPPVHIPLALPTVEVPTALPTTKSKGIARHRNKGGMILHISEGMYLKLSSLEFERGPTQIRRIELSGVRLNNARVCDEACIRITNNIASLHIIAQPIWSSIGVYLDSMTFPGMLEITLTPAKPYELEFSARVFGEQNMYMTNVLQTTVPVVIHLAMAHRAAIARAFKSAGFARREIRGYHWLKHRRNPLWVGSMMLLPELSAPLNLFEEYVVDWTSDPIVLGKVELSPICL